MIAPLGHALVITALAMAVVGSMAGFAGGRSRNPLIAATARRSAFIVAALVALAAALMILALVRHDFSVKYVADVGSRETPLYYTVISLWGALEGSILFWALVLSAYTSIFLLIYRQRFSELQPYITAVLLGISAFFLFVIAGPGNPFASVSPIPADGPGPNPLLQNHPMMGLHPPLLYLGYVGLSVPFAIAMAALLRGTPGPADFRLMRRWALIPWVFLSLGIVAGMWWSYAVLGWGGYWSWDPVENASIMPWLVTTAFLHSLQVQERRQMLKTWTLALIIAAFLLSILGTFLTRSGVLSSVHSFTVSAIGPVFLAFLGSVLVGSLALLFARSRALASAGVLDSSVCRETAFLCNNLVLVVITFTILLGTMFPLIAEALRGSQLSVGAPYFNRVTVPLGVALLFLMGVGPVLPWGAARMEELQWRLLPPVATGVAAILALLLLGVRGITLLIVFGLAAFVLAVTLGRLASEIRVRQRNAREEWLVAARHLFGSNPRRYGGYVVHLGVVLIVIGLAASQSYGVRATGTLRPGQALSIDGYKVVFRGVRTQPESNRMVIAAPVETLRAGRQLGNLRPSLNYYRTLQDPVVTPSVREEPWDMLKELALGQNPLPDLGEILHGRNPFEDVYVVLEGINPKTNSATFLVLVNPMVGFIWLGGIVAGTGGIFALLPARRRKVAAIPEREQLALQPEEVPA